MLFFLVSFISAHVEKIFSLSFNVMKLNLNIEMGESNFLLLSVSPQNIPEVYHWIVHSSKIRNHFVHICSALFPQDSSLANADDYKLYDLDFDDTAFADFETCKIIIRMCMELNMINKFKVNYEVRSIP